MKVYNTNINEIAKIRTEKSGIYKGFSSVEECISNLIGIQAQYNQFAMLSIYNRVSKCKPSDIEELGKEYRIIKVWGQRVTLHIYNLKDWELINTIYSTRINWVKNYTKKLGVDIEATMNTINELGKRKKVFLKTDVKETLNHSEKNKLMDWGGILIEASLKGLIIGVVSMNDEKKYLHKIWLKDYIKPTVENGMKMLLKRYYKNYGPATINDFKHFSGLNKFEFIEPFEQLKEQMISLKVDDKNYYMFENDYVNYNEVNHSKKIKMLGKFDPLLVSYKHKEWIADEEYIKTIWGKGGQIAAVIISNDRVIGVWRYRIKGTKMDFIINLFYKISTPKEERIKKQAKEIAVFFGKTMGEISINLMQ